MVQEVIELIDFLSEDNSIPKNIRSSLCDICSMLKNCNCDDKALKIDKALQMVEDMSLDPNISSFARTQIWNLTSLLESASKE